jgi:Ctf8
MVGKVVDLKTPLGVLVERAGEQGDEREWLLRTVIRRKLVFDVRPEPVFPEEADETR